MFSKGIHLTAFTSDAAGSLFSNIFTTTSTPDQSFLATLRAMLLNRLPQDESVQLHYNELQLSEINIHDRKASRYMNFIVPESARYPTPHRHSIFIMCTTDADANLLDIVRNNEKRYLNGYIRRDDLQVFYARKFKALFYIDVEERTTLIYVNKLELKHFHALQMMISKYLPRLFTNAPLTEKEMALLKSTGEKSSIAYEKLLEEFAEEVYVRAELIRSKLAGFETVFERIRADELRSEIQMLNRNCEHHLSMFRKDSDKLQSCKYTLAGLECIINNPSGDSEMMEYFMCNKNLTIIRVNNTAIEFVVTGYADVYDEEGFAMYASNHDGFLYSELHPAISKIQMERLYRAIFGDGNYRLRMCAAYRADMRGGLTALGNYSFLVESKTYLPNPHIQHFGCIGSYAGRFIEYAKNRDYVGAIEQAAMSARNLNFYDSMVMTTFARKLSATTATCIESPEGVLLTPQEAIAELEGGEVCPDPLF